jgi:hypothetical protein
MDALESVREVDTQDTQVRVDRGEGESNFMHFFTASGAMAPELVGCGGLGHTSRERIAQSACRDTVKNRANHQGPDTSTPRFLQWH